MKRIIAILAVIAACILQVCAQISVKGYSLVYSSETPQRAAALLNLSDEELANCTGDFMSTENMERHWAYSNKASSDWNKRMGTTTEERALVHKVEDGHLHLLARTTNGTASGFITSGVNMKQGYKYGIFEIKANCPPPQIELPGRVDDARHTDRRLAQLRRDRHHGDGGQQQYRVEYGTRWCTL